MSQTPAATPPASTSEVPDGPFAQPGSDKMPAWDVGELPPAPQFNWRKWTMFLGPGLVMGASAIGGGEWLTGPVMTAQFGGSLFWLATLSILGQVVYNIEISRYALYTGEPIFTGKFRTLPGPMLWLWVYLILDIGSILPYLASNGAIPLFALIYGHIPDPKADAGTLKIMACLIFVSVFIPLSVGGKIYNSMKAMMTFKLITVFGFLLFLGLFYSSWSTWVEIFSGFVKFGNIPVIAEKPGDPTVDNVFVSLWQGRGLPHLNWGVIGFLASMVAISGNGGLTNTPISNYTRDQGWGMGAHVGAIPSIVGGHSIELSHTGMVFRLTRESLARWKSWLAHVMREQYCVWMPACFFGLALPSMLSVQFLPRGTVLKDKWLAAGMTADGVKNAVGHSLGLPAGNLFWYLTLFCGFLVLGTSMASTADGVLRRWIDVFWTAIPALRKWDTRHIGRLYFGVLCVYLVLGLIILTFVPGDKLLVLATGMIYNYALGFSCLHVLFVNLLLLPRELRPRMWQRVALVFFGAFFSAVAVMSTIADLPVLRDELQKAFHPPAAESQSR